MRKLIAVVGPTGSGKTSLGVSLARTFDGVIISADSRQVYRGLDVGSNKEGKPGQWQTHRARVINGVSQLMVDVVEPMERFSLAAWLSGAEKLVEEIFRQGKLPIVVGGTGLYVSALTEGYAPGQGRFAKLKKRVSFESLILYRHVDRQQLYQRLDKRYEEIFDALAEEISRLVKAGVTPEWLLSLGLDYRFGTLFVLGQLDRAAAIAGLSRAGRGYIRRQITWWRHHGQPLPVNSTAEAERFVRNFLNQRP